MAYFTGAVAAGARTFRVGDEAEERGLLKEIRSKFQQAAKATLALVVDLLKTYYTIMKWGRRRSTA
ncbi:MAG: hypothetical protein KAV87_32910 [Desulfobacteraceae bacterium]|nr:hypothetical protein [Desulfobacteraceae bacterium]